MAVLRVLAEHCSYGASLNDMLRDRIVCGINHDKIQQRLLAEKDLSCAKTLELANSIEVAEKGNRDIKNSQATGSSSTVNWQGSAHGRAESHRYSQRSRKPPEQAQRRLEGPSSEGREVDNRLLSLWGRAFGSSLQV